MPVARVKLVQPIENGVVRAIHVRDGQRVKDGDILVELDPTEAVANVETLHPDLLKAQLDAATGAALLTDGPASNLVVPEGATGPLLEAARLQMLGEAGKLRASLAAIDADIEELKAAVVNYETQLKKAKDTLPLIEERLAGLETLNEQRLARKPELLAVRQNQVETKAEIVAATSSIEQAKARLASRISKRAEIKSAAEADVLQRRAEGLRRVTTYEQQLKKEERRQADRQLRAPIDGTVLGLTVFTVGGVVTTKDTLMRIVPEGSQIEAAVLVLNKDIGFIEIGQPVELKLETFPFTRYGLIEGNVKQVWRDALPDDKNGLIYKAEISLKQERKLVGNRWVQLAPGMAVQAEIKTGERRAIDYFLSPLLRYRDESLRER